MPLRLSDGNIALYALTTRPKNLAAPTVEEIKKGVRVDCAINKEDYKLGPTGSSTIGEVPLCKRGDGKSFGPSQYEGSVTPFWYLDENGRPVEAEMKVWNLFKTKGTTLYLVEREGPEADVEIAENDIVSVYEVITDVAQTPSGRTVGYIKRIVPLGVLDARLDVFVKA